VSPFLKHIEARARRTHVADIREPLVRAIWWHRYAQRCEADAGPITFDPDLRERQEDMIEEALEAQSRCDRLLSDMRSTRELSRSMADHANSNERAA
jgi:hypothetical protein